MSSQRPREFNRYSVQALARVRKIGSDDWTDVRVVTLSSMGASFAFQGQHLKKEDSIEFFMAAPNQTSPPYHLSARIAWVKDGQVGVEFTGNMAAG